MKHLKAIGLVLLCFLTSFAAYCIIGLLIYLFDSKGGITAFCFIVVGILAYRAIYSQL